MSTRRLALLMVSAVCLWIASVSPAPGVVQPEQEPSTLALADAAFQERDYEHAVTLYRRAMQEGVNFQPLHYRLGYALHALGRVDEALPHHVRGAGSTGGAMRSACLYNAACASARLGRTEDALAYLQKAIDAGFADTQLAASDADLDPIRQEERFESIIAAIGGGATLHRQLDFLLGRWEARSDDGSLRLALSFERPSPNSSVIITAVTGGNGVTSVVGMMAPDSDARAWEWVEADGIGTTIKRRGVAAGGSVTFEGVMSGPTGAIARLRVTRSIEPDGRLKERAETSWDEGQIWELHHEDFFTRAPDATTRHAPGAGG